MGKQITVYNLQFFLGVINGLGIMRVLYTFMGGRVPQAASRMPQPIYQIIFSCKYPLPSSRLGNEIPWRIPYFLWTKITISGNDRFLMKWFPFLRQKPFDFAIPCTRLNFIKNPFPSSLCSQSMHGSNPPPPPYSNPFNLKSCVQFLFTCLLRQNFKRILKGLVEVNYQF